MIIGGAKSLTRSGASVKRNGQSGRACEECRCITLRKAIVLAGHKHAR
jgi:hypothetical protein